jgi:hypothetical protein
VLHSHPKNGIEDIISLRREDILPKIKYQGYNNHSKGCHILNLKIKLPAERWIISIVHAGLRSYNAYP